MRRFPTNEVPQFLLVPASSSSTILIVSSSVTGGQAGVNGTPEAPDTGDYES